jgi:hypothetical protein
MVERLLRKRKRSNDPPRQLNQMISIGLSLKEVHLLSRSMIGCEIINCKSLFGK